MTSILFGVTIPTTAHAFLGPQLSELVAGNWDVHLACSPDLGFHELYKIGGVTIHSLPMERNPNPARDLISLFRWFILLRKLKPDIIVGSTPKAALLSMLAGKWNRIPARVYHARGFRAEGLTGLKKRLALIAERRTIRAATAVLCDSHSLLKALVAAGCLDANFGTVLGAGSCCGVDTTYFRPPTHEERKNARECLGVTSNEFVVGFVGRVTHDKGISELIQAVIRVNRKFDQVKLVLVGPDEGAAPKSAHLTPDSPVRYLGAMSDVRSAYWAFDVFALPSYREGFPIAPLEAQACGLPLITTSATGCVDSQTPENSQLTVPPGNSEAIYRAINSLVTNPSGGVSMGHQARDWVAANFNAEDVVQRQVDFLSEQTDT